MVLTIHHRKPKSLGGKKEDRNNSYVYEPEHQSWTALFYNVDAPEVALRIHYFYNNFGGGKELTRTNFPQKLIRSKKDRIKMKRAWRVLFGGLPLQEILSTINQVWLDPDYRLVVKEGFILATLQEKAQSMVA